MTLYRKVPVDGYDVLALPEWLVPVEEPVYVNRIPNDPETKQEAMWHLGVMLDMDWLVEIGDTDGK